MTRGDASAECPTFQPDQIFVCLEEGPEFPASGCDIGCFSCLDTPGVVERGGAATGGSRYLRPKETGSNRDARGLLHDFRTAEPHPIPGAIDLERAPCSDNFGEECWGYDICECHPGPDPTCLPPPDNPDGPCQCEGGEAMGQPMLGYHPDCGGYLSAEWTSLMVQCRLVHQHGPLLVHASAGRMFQTALVRDGLSGCSGDALIECTSDVRGSDCPSGYIFSQEPPPQWYNDGICHRTVFNWADVIFNITEIRTDIERPKLERTLVDAKNAVLSFIATDPLFPDGKRLDRVDLNPAGTGYWRRGAGTPVETPCDDPSLLVAYTYPESYLRYSGCHVFAELILLSAMIEFVIDAKKVNRRRPQTNMWDREVYPHVRARITAECGIRARFMDEKDDCVLVRSWLPKDHPEHSRMLTIEPSCRGFPKVEPPIDEIIYVDAQGRRAVPPRLVRWMGYHGDLGIKPPHDVWADANQCQPGNELRKKCLKLASALSPSTAEGWPYAEDKDHNNKAQVYGGQITITFDTSAYAACCGEPGEPGGPAGPVVEGEEIEEIAETEIDPFLVIV